MKEDSKQKQKLVEVADLKRDKISNYPYYPVTYALYQNDRAYVFNLDYNVDEYNLQIVTFKLIDEQTNQFSKFNTKYIVLDCLPRKNVNFLSILNFEDNPGGKSHVKSVEFVVGFAAGYLIRCAYKNTNNSSQGRQLKIIGKYNKGFQQNQSFFVKMSQKMFSSGEFYKVSVDKPVRSFKFYGQNKKLIYRYSYLIGNRLYFSRQFDQITETKSVNTFNMIKWQQISQDKMASLSLGGRIIKTKRHKTLYLGESVIIDWKNQIPYYLYTEDNQLIIADNEDNKILFLEIGNNLQLTKSYQFDLDIKRMNYFKQQDHSYLIILPYDNNLYMIRTTDSHACCLTGHKSYISQAFIDKSEVIITGGFDHRIGLKNLRNIKSWQEIICLKGNNWQKATKHYNLESQKIKKQKLEEIYFLGEFNNVNSQRNNNNHFGFGDVLQVYRGRLYAFIRFDFFVKVYQVHF